MLIIKSQSMLGNLPMSKKAAAPPTENLQYMNSFTEKKQSDSSSLKVLNSFKSSSQNFDHPFNLGDA